MKRRLEVLFQSGLQRDSTMEGKWLVPDPCVVGGRLTVSGLGWWAEDRLEWGEPLWGGGAPSALAQTLRAEQEKSSAAESRRDRSKSGFLIFFLARTDCRRSRLRSVKPSLLTEVQGREDEMRLTSNSGATAGSSGSYFKGSIRVKERQHFDSLSSGGGGGGVGLSPSSKDKCYLCSLSLALVAPLEGFSTKTWAKIRKNWMSFSNKWPVFLRARIF